MRRLQIRFCTGGDELDAVIAKTRAGFAAWHCRIVPVFCHFVPSLNRNPVPAASAQNRMLSFLARFMTARRRRRWAVRAKLHRTRRSLPYFYGDRDGIDWRRRYCIGCIGMGDVYHYSANDRFPKADIGPFRTRS
jgi:hypothetical protein